MEQDLTPEEVSYLLSLVRQHSPVVVGGQALSLWIEILRIRYPNFLIAQGAFTSKDIDFMRNREVVEALLILEKLRAYRKAI